ncbi:hypothetical protein FB45DRAFT_920952 [Roridomyces roridus]|uniref:Uncharacterized protein n=1 Tax=Roridomyces roridus TaxID=1738132 RepID=A0AAD7FJ80_9AGAR|nr:hypothetical protein FB45DRAFT_920952 [Roridomyces roridus]
MSGSATYLSFLLSTFFPRSFHLHAMAMVDDSYPSTQMTPAERLRLVRSLRKIGALLGETPILDDSQSETPELCMPSVGKQRPFHLRLALRPQQQQLPDDAHDIDIDSLPSAEKPQLFEPLPAVHPLSPLFSPLSPITPTAWTEHDATIARGHRMAKLTRTLGERVPTALIRASPTLAPTVIKCRKRASTLLISSAAPPPAPPRLALDDLTSRESSDVGRSPIGDMHVHPALLSPVSPFLSPGTRASIADWLFPQPELVSVSELVGEGKLDDAQRGEIPPPLSPTYDELPNLPIQDLVPSRNSVVDIASHRRENSWIG